MTNSKMNPKIDDFLSNAHKWQQEFEELRRIILDCGLTEKLKWNLPCYTFQNNNIVIIQGFKNYCALMFFKGALLKDPESILTRPGENSQSQRQIRFTDVQEIVKKEATLKAYINEAIEVQKAGLEVKKTTEFTIPDELQKKFDESPDFKKAFEALTPGRQRAYILYFSKAKQSKTRESRIEKYTEHIFNGKGLND
ncbi:YdeI family protein [Salinibacillus aidingensis]|uniref:YdeI family protein n=1 Tax=Salinibacillus aidingensis TaxID=237684 RepID=A0ABN1AX78_9BACI